MLDALTAWRAPRRLPVSLAARSYEVVVGDGLIRRAGALLAPVLPQKRVVVISDTNVAPLDRSNDAENIGLCVNQAICAA